MYFPSAGHPFTIIKKIPRILSAREVLGINFFKALEITAPLGGDYRQVNDWGCFLGLEYTYTGPATSAFLSVRIRPPFQIQSPMQLNQEPAM